MEYTVIGGGGGQNPRVCTVIYIVYTLSTHVPPVAESPS